MQHNRVLILRGHPHTIARAVLLKVTFVQAPQLNVGAPGQTAEFFLPRQFSADPPERLGGVVCGAESPSSGIAFDIAAPPSARGSGDADAPTRPGHPTVWRGCRSPGGSSADRLAACATDQHQAQRGGLSVRPHATPRDRPAQSGAPNAAPLYHSHHFHLRRDKGTCPTPPLFLR